MKNKIHHRGKTYVLDKVLTPANIEERMRNEIGKNRSLAVAKGSGAKPLNQLARSADLGNEVKIIDYPGGTHKGEFK